MLLGKDFFSSVRDGIRTRAQVTSHAQSGSLDHLAMRASTIERWRRVGRLILALDGPRPCCAQEVRVTGLGLVLRVSMHLI